METTCVNREGLRLFCRVEGEGIPVLLIHGSIVDCDFFREASAFLSRGFRVISYDRRGYSRSEPGKDYSLGIQVQDAADILRSFAGERKTVVVGCSLGALIAMRLAADHPEAVDALFLHEPPLLCWPEVTDEEENRLFASIGDKLAREKYKSAMLDFLTLSSRYPYEGARSWPPEAMDRQLQNGLVFAERECRQQFFLPPEEYGVDRLKGRNVRCFVGDASGPAFTVRAARRLAQELDCPLLTMPGGHNAAHDLPEEFTAMLAGLLSLREE